MDLDNLFTVPSKKVRFVELTTKEREVLHQFLDANYPNLKKFSVRCKRLEVDCVAILVKCYECDKPIPVNYHDGYMENNQDEYYSGYCNDCEISINWECNFDDDEDVIRIIRKKKMFVFGDYTFNQQVIKYIEKGDHEKNEIIEILKDKHIYEVARPEPLLSDKQIGWYLYWSLNRDNRAEKLKNKE